MNDKNGKGSSRDTGQRKPLSEEYADRPIGIGNSATRSLGPRQPAKPGNSDKGGDKGD